MAGTAAADMPVISDVIRAVHMRSRPANARVVGAAGIMIGVDGIASYRRNSLHGPGGVDCKDAVMLGICRLRGCLLSLF